MNPTTDVLKQRIADLEGGAAELATGSDHANLLFSNWLNYCVYQLTPFENKELQS